MDDNAKLKASLATHQPCELQCWKNVHLQMHPQINIYILQYMTGTTANCSIEAARMNEVEN